MEVISINKKGESKYMEKSGLEVGQINWNYSAESHQNRRLSYLIKRSWLLLVNTMDSVVSSEENKISLVLKFACLNL